MSNRNLQAPSGLLKVNASALPCKFHPFLCHFNRLNKLNAQSGTNVTSVIFTLNF